MFVGLLLVDTAVRVTHYLGTKRIYQIYMLQWVHGYNNNLISDRV